MTVDPLKKLMAEAHRNPQLKHRLLHEPEAVAKEFKVEIGPEEIQRLRSLGALTDLVHETVHGRLSGGCDPRVCYPAHIWEREAMSDLVARLRGGGIGPIFYPAERERLAQQLEMERPLMAERAMAQAKPIMYPILYRPWHRCWPWPILYPGPRPPYYPPYNQPFNQAETQMMRRPVSYRGPSSWRIPRYRGYPAFSSRAELQELIRESVAEILEAKLGQNR